MKYCITILLVLIFIIIFNNLLNYNTIETFHTGSQEITQTELQRNINTAITNIGSANKSKNSWSIKNKGIIDD